MNRTFFLHLPSLVFFLLGFSQTSFAQCEAISGTVSTTAGENRIYTCPGDGMDDFIQFEHQGTNEDLAFQYVVTDSEFNVIGLPPSGELNFEGAGEGTCYVFGFNFDGNILLQPGAPVFTTRFSDGCYQITRTKVEVIRSVADGGTVAMPDGSVEKTVCTTDGYDNVIRFTHETSSRAAYRYVITDDQNNILGLPPGDNLNFEGVFPGVCRIWGLSYTGTITAQAGDNAAEVALSDGCFDLSDNFITVIRTDVDGGTVSTADGETTVNTVPGDGNDDIVMFAHESGSDAAFIYIVTDENNKIIGTPPGNMVNFEGAGEGTCRVWGVSYTGDLRYLLGGTVGNFALSSDCFEVSENFVEVIRSADGACDVSGGEISTDAGDVQNRAVIANRASGTISVIDGDSGALIKSYDMPDDGQPMYVVHNALNNTVLVGDYNGQVVAFDGSSFDVVGSVAAGAGVFHMWISPDYQQLWVNNELEKTISVVNPTTLEGITTFDIPADLLDAGFKPHDVIVDPDNSAAYVTFLGSDADIDYVVKYDATTFEEITRAEVGVDPHVSLTTANELLYVASQGADLLQILNRDDLSTVSTIDVPNAHGLGMNAAGTNLYIGNISEGGTNATYTLDVMTNTLVDSPVDAPFAVPHNYAVGSEDGKLYVTHSGMTAFQVSIYDLGPTPTLVGTLNTGMNPFGLVAYSFTDDAELTICADDGVSDAFDVALEGNTGASAWVITDEAGNILALPPTPPFDLDGAGAGTCLIWHLSFEEDGFSGAAVGNNALTDLEGCYNLSNSIKVIREVVDGGVVTTADGETAIAVTVNDGIDDVIAFAHTDASETGFAYVVTDEAGTILGIPPANEVNFEGAGVGTCLVWGLAYTGEVTAQLGDNALEVALSSGCFDLSDEFVTVVRTEGGSNIINPNVQGSIVVSADLTIAPNPISTKFNVQFNTTEAANAQLSIYNIFGQLIETRSIDTATGFNQYELDGSHLVNGNYIVELRTASATYNVSVVKQ